MSSSRRRPSGGIRRPQVAGRPRGGWTDAADTADEAERDEARSGTVAVDERSTAAVDAPRAAPVRSGTADADGPAADGSAADGSANNGSAADGSRTGGPDPDGPAPDGSAGGGSAGGGSAADTRAGAGADGADPDAAASRSRRLPLPPAPRTRAATAALLVVTVVLTAAAAFFGVQWYGARFSGSAANAALTDVGATAEVSREVGDAVTKVYSFDHARLQQAEDEARAVITPEFQPEFDRIFGSVRELAPQQQAVVTATIPKSAVASITGDRATVYLFVNQVIRRQAAGGAPQEGSAAARLRVDAEYVDGSWKIAAMTPA